VLYIHAVIASTAKQSALGDKGGSLRYFVPRDDSLLVLSFNQHYVSFNLILKRSPGER